MRSMFIYILLRTTGGHIPHLQAPAGDTQFFDWYFYGLGGLGGWLVFAILGLILAAWLILNSQARRLPVSHWRAGILLLLLMILPTMLFRATVNQTDYQVHQLLELYEPECPEDVITRGYPEVAFQDCDQLRRSLPALAPHSAIIFYLGILGGVLAPALAIGYFITYRGMTVCDKGHVFDIDANICPECSKQEAHQQIGAAPLSEMIPATGQEKPIVQHAWLVDVTHNRRFDLYLGATRIGRDQESDIVLNDLAVSRPHASIREAGGRFMLSDLGSSTGTLLNGKQLRAPQELRNGDIITVGDTDLKFITSL